MAGSQGSIPFSGAYFPLCIDEQRPFPTDSAATPPPASSLHLFWICEAPCAQGYSYTHGVGETAQEGVTVQTPSACRRKKNNFEYALVGHQLTPLFQVNGN